jgi:Reverse transcriptase (RNA-dependent DNA polymerase)
LLPNVYLHYAFDLWVEVWRKKIAKGDADDLVVGFQHRAEAERFLKEFRERLAKFGLEMHPEKTRLIEFGREAWANRHQEGKGKPETFQFLGFTHYCWENSKGYFTVWRGTGAKRMRAKLSEIKARAKNSDARADRADLEMAEAGGARLLPIPRGAGQSTQAEPIPPAVAGGYGGRHYVAGARSSG